MSEQPLICELKTGDAVVGYLLASDAAYKTTRTGSEYLELKLTDASGELKGFLWDLKAVEGDFAEIVPDVFVKVKGKVEEFQGRKQIRVDKVRFAPDSEVGDFSRFFPTSKRSIDGMLQELDALVQGIGDPWIRRLLERLLVQDPDRRAAFAKAPAAKSLHHVYLGGLLEHTLSVAAMAVRACEHYRNLNRDLVLAGVLLHDLGKTAELSYQRSFGYTDTGNLLGHITLEAAVGLPGHRADSRGSRKNCVCRSCTSFLPTTASWSSAPRCCPRPRRRSWSTTWTTWTGSWRACSA